MSIVLNKASYRNLLLFVTSKINEFGINGPDDSGRFSGNQFSGRPYGAKWLSDFNFYKHVAPLGLALIRC